MTQGNSCLDSVTKDRILRYSIAVFCTLLATVIRIEMDPIVGDRVPFGTYLLSVLLTASLAGIGPAVASLIMGIVAATIYIIPHSSTLGVPSAGDLIALTIYGVVGAATIWLFYSMTRQNRVRADQLARIEILTAELKLAARQKDEFLAILAHELRNPLAPIRNGLTILRSSENLDKSQSTTISTMSRQLKQLVNIVDDLLDVSRFVHGKIRLERKLVDLKDLIEFSISQAKCQFDDKRHCVSSLAPPHPVYVFGDRNRLTQVVTNLLTNAAKYTPQEGKIMIILEEQDDRAVLRVVDDGIGITEEMQPRIFELFSRGEGAITRDMNGLGLGLPIARQFALMHEGQLTVESEGIAQGSQFTLILPLATSEQIRSGELESDTKLPFQLPPDSEVEPSSEIQLESDTPVSNAVHDDQEPNDDEPGTRVLIVDDNVDAAETLSSLLDLHGFTTKVCHEGIDAINEVPKFHPQVVLLDIGMRGMNGYEVARTLRSDPKCKDLLLVAVTGWGEERDKQRSLDVGFDYHLVKPVDLDLLAEILQQAPALT